VTAPTDHVPGRDRSYLFTTLDLVMQMR
jgi:hypothetical protein